MTTSSTVGRCWMAYLLLVFATHTLARPPQQNLPMMMSFCGRDLASVIDEVCVTFKSPAALIDPLALISPNQTSLDDESVAVDNAVTKGTELNDKSASLLRQCCVIGCMENDLANFCPIDRNEIMEAAMQLRSQDWDIDWLYEFLPQYGAVLTHE